jgi:hypothetical protein
MKCKECGSKVPISKSFLITVIVESVIIFILCAIIILLSLVIADNDVNSDGVYTGKDAAIAMADTENSSLYYKQCAWCPNYGYITKAELVKWNVDGDKVYHTYKFLDKELSEYANVLEQSFFERNEFSNDKLIVYSRKFGDTVQSISLAPNRNSGEILIFASEE